MFRVRRVETVGYQRLLIIASKEADGLEDLHQAQPYEVKVDCCGPLIGIVSMYRGFLTILQGFPSI